MSEDNITIELRKLIRKRAAVQSSIEVIKEFVTKFDHATHSHRQLKIRLTKLQSLFTQFEDIQSQINDLDQGSYNDDDRLRLEDEVNSLVATIEDLIEQYTPITPVNISHSSQLTGAEFLKLPAIQAPTFNGNLQDWASFIDTFNSLFHNNPNLTDVQRLHYLKTSVTGPAADVLRNFSIISENYQPAYEELVKQYENKSLTIQTHIRSLLHSPKVNTASASELRKLYNHVVSHVRALKALNQPVQQWDAWLVTIIHYHLDSTTASEWQLLQTTNELPTFCEMEKFLSKRISAYEVGAIAAGNVVRPIRPKGNQYKQTDGTVLFSNDSNRKGSKCVICAGFHRLYMCEQFNKMSIVERKAVVFKNHLCFNCLRSGHQLKNCLYSGCPKCAQRHNSKLHDDILSKSEDTNPSINQESSVNQNDTVLYTETTNQHSIDTLSNTVMLATAMVYIYDKNGQPHNCRAVLDSGSQLNFIKEDFVKRLGLTVSNSSLHITGVSAMSSSANHVTTTTIGSRFYNHKFNVTFHALPLIVNLLPSQRVHIDHLNIPDNIKQKLADPQFYVPGSIDILLGAEVFYTILGKKKWVTSTGTALHHTNFGWIITGKLPIALHGNSSMLSVVNHTTTVVSMDSNSALSLLNSVKHSRSQDEMAAEEHFKSSVSRNEHGRFIVKLPFKQSTSALGSSLAMAVKRFFNLECKLIKDANLAKQYNDFMTEYLKLGHMEPVPDSNECEAHNFLPHHAVLKDTSITTKMRVVFDASAKTASGLSLNDIMLKGPTVQPTLVSTLLRFRIHQVALTADVEKMYRQILVSPQDRHLQTICYRLNPTDTLSKYQLCTVTYGTKSAPYLATRCLIELGTSAPSILSQRTILNDFYVDDLLSGGKNDDECYQLYEEVSNTLAGAGMLLRQWCTSSSTLLNQLPSSQNDSKYLLQLNDNETISTLGITWNPHKDCFHFILKPWSPPNCMTKRSLLADINRIYDPLGFITPVLIKGKIFLQKLWLLKIDWDTTLPRQLCDQWTSFYHSMTGLNKLSIYRRVVYGSVKTIQLHGFCDASQDAYGACVYIRTMESNSNWTSSLYTSKSRVAPTHQTTIPRLELCGAVLLSELVNEIISELNKLTITVKCENIILWTDSNIVLAWIQSSYPLKQFVANRVAQILDVTQASQWRHVPTHCNPADIITRGLAVELLAECTLWWHGPRWLTESEVHWPVVRDMHVDEVPELRPIKLTLVAVQHQNTIIEKFSEWTPLIRITSWMYRFIHNIRCKKNIKLTKLDGPLTVRELFGSRMHWLRYAQSIEFSKEIYALCNGHPVSNKSRLKSLNPFIDQNNLIRVGGRLSKSQLTEQQKFPIVLPAHHKITKMLFIYEHKRLLHAGPQALLASIHTQFWPLRGREVARLTVRQCIICFKYRPTTLEPLMAPLPRQRTIVQRPFTHTGVDFCGPIGIRSGIRRVTSIKAYVSVFVCFSTRAVHLELVSSLTSDAFIAAFKRFIARRGHCSNLYSDNGTNFVGANKELQSYSRQLHKTHNVEALLTSLNIQWHFTPPATPHFGGLWESAVKSTKTHLLKITKGALFTFEEVSTFLCQVEAVLNSRPLTPLSMDPSDFTALTPAHFLIGEPLTQLPEPTISTEPKNQRKRWELIKYQTQQFWKRWTREYLPQLQRHGRWITPCRPVKEGDLVLLKEDHQISLQWKMVRVVAVHPGADGIVRVVTVRDSQRKEFRRPVVKLALLPTPSDEDNEEFSQS